MADETERHWRLEAYRNKLRHSLRARFLIHFHVALILAATIASGWLVDRMLLEVMHAKAIIVRYPLAILAAYFVFFAGVAAWLRFSGVRGYLDPAGVEELTGDGVQVPPQWWGKNDDEWVGLAVLFGDPIGCLWGVAMIVLFFGFGGYVLYAAPSLFADVLLEVILAAGLLRGMRRAEKYDWMNGVVANTWPSLLFSLIVAFFIGLFALGQVPPSTTIHELWNTMRHSGR